MDKPILFLPLIALMLSSFCHGTLGKSVIVTLPGHHGVEFQGAVADFGYQFDQLTSHPANLMLAPEDDPFLCSYPSSLPDNILRPVENAAVPRNEVTAPPLALLISRGQCSLEAKVEVAIALQKNYTQDLQYVIIYNNDDDNPNRVIRMTASDDNVNLPHLGFVTVSTRAGAYLVHEIYYYAVFNHQNPYLGANETGWEYPIVMEEACHSSTKDTFYMILIGIFSTMILAPCFRAMYLLQTGVVRIEFRRNEHGRIVGLRFVRTMPAAQGSRSRRSKRKHLLTEEQVRHLPEITYMKKESAECMDDISLDSCEVTVESHESHQPGAVEPSALLVRIMDGGPDEEMGHQIVGPDDEPSEGSPVAVLAENCTTPYSTCSICIDDFQDGERIRMLPKCKHAFHLDCLMPWLTQRQSCCPVCKRSVLESDNEDDHGAADERAP